MEKRTIWVKPSTFAPEFEMIIPVPTDRDDEEYIDELLDGILNGWERQCCIPDKPVKPIFFPCEVQILAHI